MIKKSSTTDSAAPSGLGSLNFGSGVGDLDNVYSQLEAAENKKLTTYDTQKNSVETKISAYSTIKNSLDSLKSQASALTESNFQKSAVATVASDAAYTATATDNSIAGTYDIQVNRLATSQSTASLKVDDKTSKLGSGTITLTQDGKDYSVAIKDTSLEGVRNAINAARDSDGNKLGVSAAVVSDDNGGAYLTLNSTKTGKAGSFSVSATGDSGLTNVISNMSTKKTANNAEFTINGVTIESASNSVTNAVPGLELTLASVSKSPETLTVSNNTNDWANGVSNFVTSYNNFLKTTKELTRFDSEHEENKDNGVLIGDSGVRTIKSQMKDVLSNQNLAALKDFGITAAPFSSFGETPAGTLQIDSAKLNKALTDNPDGFKRVLMGADGKSGIMNQVVAKVNDFEDSKKGILTTNTDSLKGKSKHIDKQKERAAAASKYRLKAYKRDFIKLSKFQNTMDAQLKNIKSQFKALKGK